jgi:hypothetical protein
MGKKGTTIYLPDDEKDEILGDLEKHKKSKYEPNYVAIKRILHGDE